MIYDVFKLDGRYVRTINCPADQAVAQLADGEMGVVKVDNHPSHWQVYVNGTLHQFEAPPTPFYWADPVTMSWVPFNAGN